MPGPHPEHPRRPIVMLLDHAGGSLAELAKTLVHAGLDVQQTSSLAESCRLLGQARPDAIVLQPLALCTGGVELELLEGLQRDDDPIPVLFLVADLDVLGEARTWKLPIRDFARAPIHPDEGLHRIDLMLLHRRRYRALVQRTRYLEGQISVDFKTGLLSELYFQRVLQVEWKRAQRHHHPLSLLLLDVDDFKSVNDSTEYAFGDEVLRKVGELLKSTVRETDFPARCGGDEFCVLLPHTTPAEAVQTALRVRQRIDATIVQKGSYARRITVSIGIDTYDGRTPSTIEILRRNANKALQEAKRRGKNQVWLFAGDLHGGASAHADN